MAESNAIRPPLKIAFIHPDLGVGGAERLVVDAAVGLQKYHGHSVIMYTSHRDPAHCFPEARDESILKVRVFGDFLPRHIFHRFHIVFAILRMIYVAMIMILKAPRFDVIFVDQVAVVVPLFKLFTRSRVVFYCHYPDLLLAPRRSLIQRLYRLPFDLLEQYTTGCSDAVFVNSRFTQGVFAQTFTRLRVVPTILHPALNLAEMDQRIRAAQNSNEVNAGEVIVSVNRFERKKNIALALEAFAAARRMTTKAARLRLVLAGGYDPRVRENVEYLEELRARATELGLGEHDVQFAPSISDSLKAELMSKCVCLLYTPANEHFGIVPVEAMFASRPVIAVNSGGPTESVDDEVTGFLCEPTPEAFGEKIVALVNDPERAKQMGERGRERVRRMFALESFARALDDAIRRTRPERAP